MSGQKAHVKGARPGRRKAFGVALLAALCCGKASAVGLGEIELGSALNQKFDARIELLEARGLQPSEVVVRLGSAEDFARVGVERFFFLTDLKFKVEQADGRTYLRVTSSQPVSEPYLNFLVQVVWPQGRLLKEYTVLLDPPAFTDNVAPMVAAPGRVDPGGGSGTGRVDRPVPRPDSTVSFERPAAPTGSTPPMSRLSEGTYGTTDRTDTLWSIASRARPDSSSVQQTMLAIARLNPEAFIGGNINLLKAGYVLRLPDATEAQSLGQAEAVAAVAEHNQAWQVYRRTGTVADLGGDTGQPPASLAAQVDATRTSGQVPAATTGRDGELRIVAPDAGASGSGAGDAGAMEAMEVQLAATEEEVDRISRERDEAVYQLDQANARAEQTARQIEVRDQQIAQLTAQIEALKESGEASPPARATTRAKVNADDGLMALLTSPIAMIGGAAIVVLLLVAGLIAARRRRAAAQAEASPLFDSAVRSRSGAGATGTAAMASAVAEEAPETEIEEFFEPAETAEFEPVEADEEPASAQTSDVIGEADIYIAYGRYPQALNLLQSALEDDPDRADVRLKLLEICAETKDQEAFDAHMSELVARCNDNEILLEAQSLEAKLRGDSTPSVEPATDAEADAFALDDDLDLDADITQTRARVASEPVHEVDQGHGDELGGDLGMDFDPDAGASQAASATAEDLSLDDDTDVALAAGDTEAEFDLEDLELEPDASARPARQAAADDAFDFLDDEDTASTKLDLARAYIDMGDEDGAKEILSEVIQEGSGEQQKQAQELLAKLA